MLQRTGVSLIGALTVICGMLFAQTGKPEEIQKFFKAIRGNNLTELRGISGDAQAVNLADGQKTTPLHYAALYGSPESVRILLAAGADPKAQDLRGATPLIYAAYDLDKTRALVEKGAAVNAASHMGQTPLLVAASAHNNTPTVKYLLDSGADIQAANFRGMDALMAASAYADEDTIRLLIERGADAKKKDKALMNSLQQATNFDGDGRISLLLQKGADVNSSNVFGGMVKNGPIALTHLTPLMLAAPYAKPETLKTLLQAGARVNDVDGRKMTPLMFAIATDFANPENVRTLLAAGANVSAKDQNGETALDWAMKFRNPEILAMLKTSGAQAGEPAAAPSAGTGSRAVSAGDALTRSSQLLATAGQGFFREGGGCAGCHHQPMAARVYASARNASVSSNEKLQKLMPDALVALRPQSTTFWTFLIDTGGDSDVIVYPLASLAELQQPASTDTDRMVHYLAARQRPTGEWHLGGIARPPIEDSNITRTAAAVQALKAYSWPARQQEFDDRIRRARAWLLNAKPVTNYERAERVLGLYYADAPKSALQKAEADLLKQQRADGGWSQTAWLDTDAYATGLALHALYVTGELKADDKAYQRGTAWLLEHQFPDGSWYVRSRAPKFQPYFQSGFPFNHDQWISSTATGWAATALAPAAALEQRSAIK